MTLVAVMDGEGADEPTSFRPLAVAVARVVDRLRCDEKQNEQNDDNRARERTADEKEGERSRYIDQRLRDLRTFERRARG